MKSRAAMLVLNKALVLSTTLVLAACASSPATRHYRLSDTQATSAAQTGAPRLAVGPISLPQLVDRPQLVVNHAGHEVAISEFDRWAQPLKDELAQYLAEALGRQTGAVVVTQQHVSATDASLRLAIDVLRFQARAGNDVQIEWVYTLRHRSGHWTQQGRQSLSEPVSGPGAAPVVAAYSRALARASETIAAQVARAPAP